MISIHHYTKEQVQQKVSAHFKIPPSYFFLPGNSKGPASWFRQVYAYCLWKFTDMRMEDIGQHMNRDHSTVAYAVNTINARCKVEPDIRKEIIEIEGLFE